MSEVTEEAPQEAPQGPETDVEGLTEAQGQDDENEASQSYEETFDREYVVSLREENKKFRLKSKKVDDLAAALVTSYVSETGRLHDPSDLPYSDDLLGEEDGIPDRDKVSQAVDALVTQKPHLARLKLSGDVGQGSRGQQETMPSLGNMLKRAAG